MLKIYPSGKDFLAENIEIIHNFPLETVFFEANAKYMPQTDRQNFLLKLMEDDKFLLAVHNGPYPMVIFGDVALCAELAHTVVELQLSFDKILGALSTCEAFLAEYELLTGATHKIRYAMEMMRCDSLLTSETDDVEIPTENDVDELANLMQTFHKNTLGESVNLEDLQTEIKGSLQSYAIIRCDGGIVSCACKKRETQCLACISAVYTSPQYRGRGFARKIVTFLTRQIIQSGKLPYLFVDKANPISNHVYTKIGYTYAVAQYHIDVVPKL